MIAMTYTQWLGVRKNNTGQNDLAALVTYWKKYVAPEVKTVQQVNPEANHPQRDQRRRLYSDILEAKAAFTGYAEGLSPKNPGGPAVGTPAEAATRLDTLIGNVNALRALCTPNELIDENTRVSRYSNAQGWEDVVRALESMDLFATESNLPRKVSARIAGLSGNQAGDIPGVKWARFKSAPNAAPPALVHLLRDIRNTWRAQTVFDTRTDRQLGERSADPLVAKRTGSTITADHPGSLRSWHMNDQKALPTKAGGQVAHRIHQHYTNTSQAPGNTKSTSQTPIGYAEYTGTGIQGDMHNSKVVLDYTNGDLFLTVTHYMRWSKQTVNGKHVYTVGSKTEGNNSAWFYIDFT